MSCPTLCRRILAGALVLLAGSLVTPGRSAAQSLLSGHAFGSPLEALDARELALGGMGMGLRGTTLSPYDPATTVDLIFPAVTFTSQTSWNDVTQGGQALDYSGTRFPSMGIIYPFSGVGTVSVSLSGVMDQNWEASEERLLTLEGSGTQARVTDRFVSEGGVSTLRLGVARRLSPTLSVGVNVGTYMGDLTRRFARTFDSLEVETSVPPFQIGGNWDYSGFTAVAGAALDVPGIARISGSYTLGGDLKANPTAGTDGSGLTLPMPAQYRVGGTAILSDRLFLNLGLQYADWTETTVNLPDVVGESVLRMGGGLEWTGASILGKPGALRVGYRTGDLPFHTVGEPAVSESIWGGGLGLNLLEGNGFILAGLDLSVERGSRDAGFLTEDFTRFSVSVRVSGF